MPDDADPPRKFYDLKPKDFDRVNAPRPDSPPPSAPAAPPPAIPTDRPIDVRELHQQANVAGPVLNVGPKRPDLNDIHTVLRENLARENAAGLNKLSDQPPRKSKRRRDYLVLMIGSNTLLGILAAHGLHSGNAILFVYCMAGIGILSASITWIMYFVMDPY